MGVGVAPMPAVLDIVALRSIVAVADCGGFHRAAAALALSRTLDPALTHG